MLPKFTNPDKQNSVHFLDDLKSYFLLRVILNSLTRTAVADDYTSQCINAVYKELSSYEQFREAITEFLWELHARAGWQCALYQSVYNRTKDGSMPANFLHYTASLIT
jgi:hypothetical protein